MNSICKTVCLEGDKTVAFARLSLEDLFSLTDAIMAKKEKLARELAKEKDTKLDNFELINLIGDIRLKSPSVAEILAGCDSPSGAATVLRASLKKSGIAEDQHAQIIAALEIPQALTLAQNLVLDVQEEEAKKDESPLSPSTGAATASVAPAKDTTAPSATLEESLKAKAVGYGGKKK